MNQNFNLIKNGMIDFEKLMVEKYAYLGLNEVEVITLIKLNNFLKQPIPTPVEQLPEKMHETMSRDASEISELLAKLIENKFIDLIEQEGAVSYTLDPTYKRIANVLDEESNQEEKNTNVNDVKKIVSLIETNFNCLVSPLDLNMINRWVNVDQYNFYDINEAIISCIQRRNKSVKLVNEILRTKKEKAEKVNKTEASDLKKMFNNVYGKKEN